MPNVPKNVDKKLREIRKIAASIEKDLLEYNEENNIPKNVNIGCALEFEETIDSSIKMFRLDYEEHVWCAMCNISIRKRLIWGRGIL